MNKISLIDENKSHCCYWKNDSELLLLLLVLMLYFGLIVVMCSSPVIEKLSLNYLKRKTNNYTFAYYMNIFCDLPLGLNLRLAKLEEQDNWTTKRSKREIWNHRKQGLPTSFLFSSFNFWLYLASFSNETDYEKMSNLWMFNIYHLLEIYFRRTQEIQNHI